MILMHHLRIGRPIFTVWLLEELGLDYELEVYVRDPETMRAPPSLKLAHPLGKSPVIVDGELTLAESGAITSYLIETYDEPGNLAPERSDRPAWATYTQWLHYAEGSAFAPLLLTLLLQRGGPSPGLIDAFAQTEVALHLGYISDFLDDKPFILGQALSGADFGVSYIVSLAKRLSRLDPHANLDDYLARIKARPAFQRAVERAVE